MMRCLDRQTTALGPGAYVSFQVAAGTEPGMPRALFSSQRQRDIACLFCPGLCFEFMSVLVEMLFMVIASDQNFVRDCQ